MNKKFDVLFLYSINKIELEKILNKNNIIYYLTHLLFMNISVYIIRADNNMIEKIIESIKHLDINYEILNASYYNEIDRLTKTFENLVFYHLFEYYEP